MLIFSYACASQNRGLLDLAFWVLNAPCLGSSYTILKTEEGHGLLRKFFFVNMDGLCFLAFSCSFSLFLHACFTRQSKNTSIRKWPQHQSLPPGT